MVVFIEDTFDSAHWLPNVPDGHQCRRLHGHTYRIRIEVRGTVGKETGWVMDYTYIKYAWKPVKDEVDHHCINDLIPNSTCENLAAWIWDQLKPNLRGLSRIELRETANCGVVYEGRRK